MDEPTSSAEPTFGTVSDQRIGSYRILQPLGTGGMSSVFRAVHVDTGHQVALKVLSRTLARNGILLQRFLREARSAESLEHGNIVTIYDRGVDRGRHYLVLEYVDGGDFHEYVKRRGPLGTVEAISVVKGVAAGLRYAATRGLIHRDVKPSNILRTQTGHIKIIDLGLALQNEFEDERVTRDGTTVGTVDYMAPEQARDSRAASIQSDLYSLGCTFYYLLAGVPPYPGGDITEKLTRHAKSPAPNICDLRPDVPAEIGSIIERMMAKNPEDRFTSYDALIAALDALPPNVLGEAAGIALVPLDDPTHDQPPAPAIDPWPSRGSGEYPTDGQDPGPPQVVSLAELAGELSVEPRERSPARFPASLPPTPLPRQGTRCGDEPEAPASDVLELPSTAPSKAGSSAPIWIISGAFVGVAFILLAIGVLQFMESPSAPHEAIVLPPKANIVSDVSIASPPRPGVAGLRAAGRLATRERKASTPETKPAPVAPPARWVEPVDAEPPASDSGGSHAREEPGSKHLPAWARAPVPDRIDGPFVVVRRVVESGDPFTVENLHMALDRYRGGTIELADEGPLFIDDLRVAGDTRLIRPRSGYRPIIRIERSSLDAVRQQHAVFVLDRKDLTLDGIDLILDVRDLSPAQTALFSCSGANLTLRNCSITILNLHNAPFAVVRAEANQSRPSHVRLEKTLVRGRLSALADLTAGSTELAMNKSVILGGPGPVVRVIDSEPGLERRLFFIDSILAGPGPMIQRTVKDPALQTRPVALRAFGSVFGRLYGVGVASVIASSASAEGAAKQIEWSGDNNLFAGWKGFFACGKDPTVTIADLAEVRSTWNGTDRESQEILAPWPHKADLATVDPADLAPFVPNREAILREVAGTRAGLFQKAVGAYPSPVVPQPVGWAVEPRMAARRGPTQRTAQTLEATPGGGLGRPLLRPTDPRVAPPVSDTVELTFDTEAPQWAGDLGAFLRDRLSPSVGHARVRVVGSGQHRFTPVRLARGLWLEIRVEPFAAAEPPSWSPDPNATGLAMIELEGGALVLSNFVLRHDETSRLPHLIHVEDGHLILSRCRFTAPGSTADYAGDLIVFRSVSTQPFSTDPNRPLFSSPVDLPICRLDETLLITGGTALRAELGRGLVALTQCAIAAGVTSVELLPARVRRDRFKADLVMDQCTLTSERSIIRLGPWSGVPPGPDRPWLITSRNCAFLAMFDRKTRETVLLRSDADALARGVVSWQASNDAADVDFFTAVGDGPAAQTRSRDVQQQWVHFWGYSHINGRMTGPRGTGNNAPSVQFWEKLHPGRVEPVDLILNPDYHPDRDRLDVGADLGRLGITRRTSRFGRPRGS